MGTSSAIVIEHVLPNRITSHSSLSEIVKAFEAPPIKETRMKPVSNWEKRAWTNYHVSQMKAAAKSAQSPDMDLTLREILTGERVVDKIATSIVVYTAMWVCFLFFLF